MRHNPSLPQEQVYEQASWVTEKKGAATRRALDGVGPAVAASGDKALEEVHRLLEEAPAEACTLVAEVAQRCPKGAQESMRALFREVRDVFVLRCLDRLHGLARQRPAEEAGEAVLGLSEWALPIRRRLQVCPRQATP